MSDCIRKVKKLKLEVPSEKIFELFKEEPNCVILDSSLHGNSLGRYSIICFQPFLLFKSKENSILLEQNGEIEKVNAEPLDLLQSLIRRYRIEEPSDEVPFKTGCIGYIAYDLGRTIEKLPNTAQDEYELYDIIMGFYNSAIIIDHLDKSLYLTASSSGVLEATDMQSQLIEKIEYLKELLIQANLLASSDFGCYERNQEENGKTRFQKYDVKPIEDNNSNNFDEFHSNFTKEQYCVLVKKAKEYIRNGDIFQVNLSQQFKIKTNQRPFELFEKLRNLSPAPFSAYLNFEDIAVISNSPERFLRLRDRTLETRPIKGTRPRGKTVSEDLIFKNELLTSEKDKAELTMIVDVHRNDLGRVCKLGTVHVEKEMEIEEYANVFHLVSTIRGELKKQLDMIDCIRAAFPGGSITGAPKIRSMEIIEELEKIKRSVYTGAIGYIDFNGDADFNIAIRTILLKEGEASYHVGGGIVWDSIPEKEYQETLDKGKALMRVLCNT